MTTAAEERAAVVAARMGAVFVPKEFPVTPDPLTALTRALFDAENTSRPDEHPEQMAAYRARAETLLRWIEFHGYGLEQKR